MIVNNIPSFIIRNNTLSNPVTQTQYLLGAKIWNLYETIKRGYARSSLIKLLWVEE